MIFVKKFPSEERLNLQTIFPSQFTNDFIQEIIYRSISLKSFPSSGNLSYQYPIVLRNENNYEKPFLYGYISYKQIATLPASSNSTISSLTDKQQIGYSNDSETSSEEIQSKKQQQKQPLNPSNQEEQQSIEPKIQQQAYILISSLPIPSIAYRILNILESTHMKNLSLSQKDSKLSTS